MLVVHLLEILDCSILIGTVVVYAKVIRRIAGNPMHEISDPCLTWRVTGTRRADQLIAISAKLHHLLEPDICSLSRGYPGSFWLIEVVDDTMLRVFDVGPVAPGKLSHVMDHGPKWSPAFQLRRCPGVPLSSISFFLQCGTREITTYIADGVHWSSKVNFVHLLWDAFVAWTIGIGPVPKQTSLLYDHVVWWDENVS